MEVMPDTSLWVDFVRSDTPLVVRSQIQPYFEHTDVVTCEPIRFELLHAARPRDRERLIGLLDTIRLVTTPPDLWANAAALGSKCADAGSRPGVMDLLIAEVCLHHCCELVTFDAHYAEIARVSDLNLRLLSRPRGQGRPPIVAERRARYGRR
jgi:predicted nucleic acid-binding protein